MDGIVEADQQIPYRDFGHRPSEALDALLPSHPFGVYGTQFTGHLKPLCNILCTKEGFGSIPRTKVL